MRLSRLEDILLKRSILRVLIALLCLAFISTGKADAPKTPDQHIFLLAQDRMLEAFGRGNPIFWSVGAAPDAFRGYELGALDLLKSIVSKMELSGVIQSSRAGSGWIDFAVLMNKERISSFSQITRDGRIGMQMNSEWFSTAETDEDLAKSMLSFDALGESLLSFPYEQVRSMETPFLTPLSQLGLQLWGLASPWSADNNGLSARSGATSHGLTYTLDTAAVRSILSQWIDMLSIDLFQYGLAGTDLFLGIDEEQFDQFVERTRLLSQTIELPSPLVINMAFGEGDTLSYARGSGTVIAGGKRSDISLHYTREVSRARIKYRLTINFQPNHSDTLVLDLSVSKRSNQKTNGAYSAKLSAHGLFDGRPYQIRYNSQLENHYHLADDSLLSEHISGTADAIIKRDGIIIADITVQQESRGTSAPGQKAVSIQHVYHTTIKDGEGVLFSGPITLSLEMAEDPEEPPSMNSTLYIETMDFIELEMLREKTAGAQETLKQNILDVLSPVMNIVQRGAQ